MPTISVCVIAKNEQDNIGCCLDSTKSFADETIVVDTGSTDATAKIARSHSAKVFSFPWIDDFSAARNFALDQASGDWIVFLDADEYISASSAKNVRPLVNRIHGDRNIEAVCLFMEHTNGVNAPVIATTQSVRLLRRSPSIRYQGRIHEAIFKHGRGPKTIFEKTPTIVLRHTGYQDETLPDKARRNLILLKQELADGHASFLTYYYLSQSYIVLKQYDKAIDYARKSLRCEIPSTSMVAHKPYVYCLKSMINLGNYEPGKVQSVLTAAQEKFPSHPEILLCAGHYQLSIGHYSSALDLLCRSLRANETYQDTLENEFPRFIALVHDEIASIYEKRQDAVNAFDYSILSLKSDKNQVSAFDRLLTLTQTQKPMTVVPVINSLYNPNSQADISFLVRRLALLNSKLLYAHYVKLLFQRFPPKQQDFSLGTKALLCNNLDHAFQRFLSHFRQSGDYGSLIMTLVTVFLKEDPFLFEELSPSKESVFHRLVSAYFLPATEICFNDGDFEHYCNLMLNFIHHATEDQLVRLLRISSRLPTPNSAAKIVDLVLQQHIYSPAFRFCRDQLHRTDLTPGLAGQLNVQAGFCCYKARDFNLAADFFAQSLGDTDSRDAAAEFLSWSHQQCNNPKIRRKIETIYASHGLEFSPTA